MFHVKKTNTAIFSNNIYLLKMVWEITPSRVILSFVNQFLTQAIWAYYSVVFMRFIFGNIDGGASRPFHEVALFLVVSIFAMLFINLFWAWYNNQFIKKNDVILKYALDKKYLIKLPLLTLVVMKTLIIIINTLRQLVNYLEGHNLF